MTIAAIATYLESVAPLALQESYDNAGLIIGDPQWECSGILCTLDVTEAVIQEALEKNCNCIIAHHPLIFRPLKRLNGSDPAERAVIMAVRNNIAVYAAHTNLDNVVGGVNGKIADKLGLVNRSVMEPKTSTLKKLFTFVPDRYLERVRSAVFAVGGGHIGNYSECGFTSQGTGSFLPEAGAKPFTGVIGQRREEQEVKLEMIFPAHLEAMLVKALRAAHPYEEPAFDIINLSNAHPGTGSGVNGELKFPMDENSFLTLLQDHFQTDSIRHSPLTGKTIARIGICGGAGSFLITNALRNKIDAFVTADMKYHEFFEADGRLLICDIGHFESEQFTSDLLVELLLHKFPTFAVLKSEVKTNPVNYFLRRKPS